MKLVVLLLLLLYITRYGNCAKILGVFHFPSKSHHILGSALLKALAARGHEVTMISPFPSKTPVKNYEDIELTGIMEYKEDTMMKEVMEIHNASILDKMSTTVKFVGEVNELVLNHTVIKDLIKSNRKFDLVIQVWAWNEAFVGLSHYLEASTIAFSTVGSSFMTNGITANPAPYSYVPNLLPSFYEEMTYLDRVINTIMNIFFELVQGLVITPGQENLRQKYFPKAPPLSELIRNVSLVLLNSHYSIESPRPHVPNMIQIGGFHLEESKQLTGELKQFMDSGKDGVIFFSLGSNVRSSDLSSDKLEGITKTFAKLPVKVLWKFERNDFLNLPSNIKIANWLPQRDILAHPNLKLFITHGGLLSTTEAVYHGVPMVGIPVFGDQESNVADGVGKGYVVKVEFNELAEETLTNAIKEVLNNPKYRENIQRRSKILRDQPVKPMDNAIFWVEYVLRHKGAHHLKTRALKLEWYQYYLLDVIAFLGAILFAVIGISYLCLRQLIKILKWIFIKNQKPSNILKTSKILQSEEKSKLA